MKVLITGGGTAGHINPGIAIAKHLREKHPESEILFLGTQRGLEKDLVPREGFKIQFIKARGFKRKISIDVFFMFKDIIAGYFQAKRIIKDFKPDVMVGTGGYVCFPVILAGIRLKIPTLIHESNSLPGIANRVLGRFVDIVTISFKDSEKYFRSSKKVIFTGNPLRKEILSIKRNQGSFDTKPWPTVLIFGGSQGAQKINEVVINMIELNKGNLPYKLIFATGQAQFDFVIQKLSEKNIKLSELKNIEIKPYIFDMADALASADLVVSRAGALTVSEITAVGLPSILIPFPYATENHQEANAGVLEKEGASVVILEKDLTPEVLHQQIINLIKNKNQLALMAKNAKNMGITDAGDKICAVVEELYKMKKSR